MLDVAILITLGILVRFTETFKQVLYLSAGWLIYQISFLKITDSQTPISEVFPAILFTTLLITVWLWLVKYFDETSMPMYFLTLIGGILFFIFM